MANFGKYTTTILYYVFLSIYRMHNSRTNMALFVTSAILNSLYSTFWDLGMDWSLLQPSTSSATSVSKRTGESYPLLRPTLGYKNPYYYYAAMVLDVLLRFNWVFYAIFTHDTQHSTIASFFISFAEVTRRGIWVIFRVENEHAANVARFKASRDVPLPYKLQGEDEEETSLVQDVDTHGKRKSTETEDGDEAGDELSRPPTAHDNNRASGSSLHRVLTHTLSRRRTPASGKQAEEGGREGLKRRMTFSRILAEAHTQDFEKKKKTVDIPNDERHGAEAISDVEAAQNSSDDEGSTADGEEGLESEREREDRERDENRMVSIREVGEVRRIVRGQNQEQREGAGGAFQE